MSAVRGCLPRGVSAQGVCPRLFVQGVSAWRGVCPGGVCPGGVAAIGVSAQGGVCPGGCLTRGCLRDTPSCGQNDRCL